MKINLGILLSGSHETPAEEEMYFPDADSMYDQLHQSGDSTSAVLVNTNQEGDVELNEPCHLGYAVRPRVVCWYDTGENWD